MSYIPVQNNDSLEMVKVEPNLNRNGEVKSVLLAAKQNVQQIKIAIENGGNILEKDGSGATALHYAAENSDKVKALEVVKYLIDRFGTANDDKISFINTKDIQGRTALFRAVYNENLDVVSILLKNQADPLVIDESLQSLLHVAASCKLENIKCNVIYILPQLRGYYGRAYALSSSALVGFQSTIKILNSIKEAYERLNLINKANSNKLTPLHNAIISSNHDLVVFLIENKAEILSIDSHNYNVLHHAILKVNEEEAIRLCKIVLDGSDKKDELINLNNGIKDSNNDIIYPIHIATRIGYSNLIKFLIDSGANIFNVDANKNSPLHLAASLGSEEKASNCVRALLENKLSKSENEEFVNLINSKKETALYVAAKNRNLEASKRLLLAGSDFTIKTSNKKTPLEKVYKNVPEAIVSLLIMSETRSGYSADDGIISDYASIDFGAILGKNSEDKIYLETKELAKICHADIERRQEMLSHTFVKIFVWMKWRKIRYWFAFSRLIQISFYAFCVYYLMRVYREICSLKGPVNSTVSNFDFLSFSPPKSPENEAEKSTPQLSECDLSGFPFYGGISIIIGSMILLIAEIFPSYQRFRWFRRPIKNWGFLKWRKNLWKIVKFTCKFLPFSQIVILIFSILTTFPVFGVYAFTDKTHVTLVAGFAFSACYCIYLQISRFPSCRVYVNLLNKILRSLFFAILVHLPIIFGFAAVFVFLLQGNPSFSSIPQAIVKVLTLSIGELDYQDAIYGDLKLLFEGIEIFAFGIFVLFIAVVLINFLVGLATDDVKKCREQRKVIWKMCTQIEQIMLLESFLDACGFCLGRYILKEYIMIMPPKIDGELRREAKMYIPSLPKELQKEFHNLNLKILSKPSLSRARAS